jgi:hypothetical protein
MDCCSILLLLASLQDGVPNGPATAQSRNSSGVGSSRGALSRRLPLQLHHLLSNSAAAGMHWLRRGQVRHCPTA